MDNILNDKGLNLGDFNYSSNKRSKIRAVVDFIWEMVKVTIISLAIILPIRYFLIQPFYVKGASMEPNFYDHEYLIIDEISYRFSDPGRGDIVVFKYPKDPSQYFIKRVVGLPGEKIEIKEGLVFIDGQTLREDYLTDDILTQLPLGGYGEVVLAEGEYFLLGDNRSQSLDSRTFGPVARDFIIGRTWLRGWPFHRLTVFNAPTYNF
ncbi:MAG TPA: signal peptidase I [bacterium]|nr:signal peptidase I [bacterium]